MKSLIQAINNLTNAIVRLATTDKTVTPKPVSQITTSNPYTGTSSVNVTPSYASTGTEGWFSLDASEKEQLYYIYKAIKTKATDSSYIPNYTNSDIAFTKMMDNLHANWPSFHAPVQNLILLKRKSIQDKYNKRINPSSKEVWNFPHQHENP
jgi:hypothetical protein